MRVHITIMAIVILLCMYIYIYICALLYIYVCIYICKYILQEMLPPPTSQIYCTHVQTLFSLQP